MKKSVSLKELPDKYIDSGLSLPEIAEYIGVSEETIFKWEKFFNFSPEINENNEKIYSKKQIDYFTKIKESLNDGKSLREVRDKLFNLSFEIISNPFESSRNFSEFKPKKEKSTGVTVPEYEIKPFLTQLTRANQRVEELLLEKTRLVENTAVEKANLTSKVEILKNKTDFLLEEKAKISVYIEKKEQELERGLCREENLGEALKISQEMLSKKEDEIINLRDKLEGYQRELQNKEALIYDQSAEIDQLLEKQNIKWWQFWKYLSDS